MYRLHHYDRALSLNQGDSPLVIFVLIIMMWKLYNKILPETSGVRCEAVRHAQHGHLARHARELTFESEC